MINDYFENNQNMRAGLKPAPTDLPTHAEPPNEGS